VQEPQRTFKGGSADRKGQYDRSIVWPERAGESIIAVDAVAATDAMAKAAI